MFRIIGNNSCYRQSKFSFLFLMSNVDSTIFFKYKSHYTALGLKSDASPKEIKSAYYKLSLQFHPDKNKGRSESVEKFREITEAYEVLGNAQKKKVYDEDLSSNYSESNWRRQNYSPYAKEYRTRSTPHTGKTSYYDYDEHYRKHYQEYNNYRQADYEYFKKRWEADYRRRHPFSDESEWTKYDYRAKPPPKFSWSILLVNKSFIYFITVWLMLCVLVLPHSSMDEPTIIYYKTSNDEKDAAEPCENDKKSSDKNR